MSPIVISAKAKQRCVSISRAGIGVPQSVVDQTGWKQGKDKVEVGFIPDALCVLLGKSSESVDAFLVSYANARSKTGARIACQAFARNYLQALVALPKRNITPIVFGHDKWCVALLLEDVKWEHQEFSKAGADAVPKGWLGIYRLLGKRSAVLRIGEGIIRERVSSHLHDHVRFMPEVKNFQYARIAQKEDAEIMEKVLIAQYEADTGAIPPLNEIHA